MFDSKIPELERHQLWATRLEVSAETADRRRLAEPTKGAFMATSVSSIGSTSSIASSTAAESQPKSVASSAAQGPQEDKVELSTTAMVIALNRQGQSVSQIAANLGLTKTVVESYLNVTSDSSSTSSAEAAALAQLAQRSSQTTASATASTASASAVTG